MGKRCFIQIQCLVFFCFGFFLFFGGGGGGGVEGGVGWNAAHGLSSGFKSLTLLLLFADLEVRVFV